MSGQDGGSTPKVKRLGLWDAAARTATESPAFRVRLGVARPGASPARIAPIKRFAGRIKTMVRQHGGGQGAPGTRRYGGIGRGGHAAAQFPNRSYPQRVTVKARVVRHKRGAAAGGKGGSAPALRRHVNYLEREGAGEGGERGIAFNSEGDLTHEEAIEFTQEIATDRHHFRFIVSPEFGEALDLKTYAQELVGAMESDLGTPLQWLGVAHYNTDNPHLHLLVRGRDSQGGDLVMHREYISHGLRGQAQEVATRHLGPRLQADIERAIRRDVRADRLTAMDLQLSREVTARTDGLVSALRASNGAPAAESARIHKLARLHHLESLGLAQEMSAGVWRVDPDLVVRLRTLGSRGDIVKLMHERLRGSEPAIATVIFSKESPPAQAITGRVFDRGVADELYDRMYLLVEAQDGKAYYVPLSEYSEAPGYEAQVGSIVTITPMPRTSVRAADRNMHRLAMAEGGVYDSAVHIASVDGRVSLPPGVSAEDYVHSHVKRAQALASRGLIEALGEGRYRLPNDFLERAGKALPGARDSGAILKVERHSLLDVEHQVRLEGLTWLDQELARGINLERPPRLGATRFERQLAAALKARAARLVELDLATDSQGQWRARVGFIDQLYERELAQAAHRLQGRFGELVRLQAGLLIQGQVAGIEQLPSGPHVIVAEAGRFALVGAQGRLAAQVGQSVELSIGRARGRALAPSLPAERQLVLRYRTLELTRTRTLGR
jgi:type IV secretory pathway VirD2 relaxase